VKINGEKVSDRSLKLARGEQAVVQVGKRKFARVTIT
jgi:tyrosyl-tRNA synthetase